MWMSVRRRVEENQRQERLGKGNREDLGKMENIISRKQSIARSEPFTQRVRKTRVPSFDASPLAPLYAESFVVRRRKKGAISAEIQLSYQTFRLAKMSVKPTVALRAILVGGIAAFAKIGGAMKAAGGVKLGAAAAAVTAAASAAVSGSKQEPQEVSKQLPK
nr:hypothetical protein TanjilG_18124 [Ipomoea batatas]GMC77458.1 hypothetical protein TanjilG_18124 [Ipomoea batatas]